MLRIVIKCFAIHTAILPLTKYLNRSCSIYNIPLFLCLPLFKQMNNNTNTAVLSHSIIKVICLYHLMGKVRLGLKKEGKKGYFIFLVGVIIFPPHYFASLLVFVVFGGVEGRGG